MPVFALNRSMAAHFGQIGSWGSSTKAEKALYFDWQTVPADLKARASEFGGYESHSDRG